MIKETSSTVRAAELWDRFISVNQGKIIQISGPYITPNEGHSALPDYVIAGSVIIEDEGNKLNG